MIFCTFLCRHHTTSTLSWLERVSQGQYLPSLVINGVPVNKDLEKLPPQLYYMKMKVCYDQGFNVIGVVIATKLRHFLFYLQPFFSALETLFQNRPRDLFLPTAASMFVKFKQNLCERYRDILERSFLWSEIR